MSHRQDELLNLAVTDPDINRYQGVEQDQLDDYGFQLEVSLNSRTWLNKKPQPKISQITLNGLWQIRDNSSQTGFRIIGHNNGQTQIEITSVAARPIQIALRALKIAKSN